MRREPGLLERDTCRDFVLPRLLAAGWTEQQIRPEYAIAQSTRSTAVDDAVVTVVGEASYVVDRSTGEPRLVEVRHVVEGALSEFGSAAHLAVVWSDREIREEILAELAAKNVDLARLGTGTLLGERPARRAVLSCVPHSVADEIGAG